MLKEGAGPIEQGITDKLNEEFNPEYLDVDNETARQTALAGETHFIATVVSQKFEGLSQ